MFFPIVADKEIINKNIDDFVKLVIDNEYHELFSHIKNLKSIAKKSPNYKNHINYLISLNSKLKTNDDIQFLSELSNLKQKKTNLLNRMLNFFEKNQLIYPIVLIAALLTILYLLNSGFLEPILNMFGTNSTEVKSLILKN